MWWEEVLINVNFDKFIVKANGLFRIGFVNISTAIFVLAEMGCKSMHGH